MRTSAVLLATLLAAPFAHAQGPVLFLRERDVAAEAPAGAVLPTAAAVGDEGDAAAAEAVEALAQARARFLASEFRDAATSLRAAEQRTTPALLRDHRALAVRLALWSGACALLGGDSVEAAMTMRRALAWDPGAELPGEFPPEVQSFFAEIARVHRSSPMVTVSVHTEPEGARIEIDGRPLGRSPITLTLPRGPHHIRVERVGYRTIREVIEPATDGAPRYRLARATPAELRAQAAAPQGLSDAPDLDTLAAMARAFDLPGAVFVARDGTRLRWPAPSSGARTQTSPWWWVLASVGGAAVVAAVVAGVVAATSSDAPPGPRLTLVLGF